MNTVPSRIYPAKGKGDCFTYDDRSLLAFETAIHRFREVGDDIWLLRDSIFNHLALDTGKETRKRFRLGFLSYLPWLLFFSSCVRRSPVANNPPDADFLVFVFGPSSKELDTLKPVIQELAKLHPVAVLWVGEEGPSVSVMDSLRPAILWHVRITDVTAESRSKMLFDAVGVLWDMFRVAMACRKIKGVGKAFLSRGTQLFDYLIHLRFWDRFLAAKLKGRNFKSVAFAADVNFPGKALARLARNRGWPTHHFLHGFPGLPHTRSIASDIHTFGEIDREFFIEHNWPPERIHACGHPRQHSLMEQIEQFRTIPPDEGGLRILFASQHGFAGGFDASHHRRTIEALLVAAKKLNLTPDEIRIRLHPSEDPAIYLLFAEEHFPNLGKPAISNRPIAEDLAWANVMVTPFSTMSIEACYAGCFLIWLAVGDFHSEIREKLIEAGYGRRATSAAQLQDALIECRDPRERSVLIAGFLNKGRELGILNSRAAVDSAARMEKLSGA